MAIRKTVREDLDSRRSQLARAIRRHLRRLRGKLPGITTFATSALDLALPLFPRQELLLRLLYGRAPGDRAIAAAMRRDLATLVHAPVAEAGLYLPPDWTLSSQGKLTRGAPITQVCLIMGRRSSKTTLAAVIEAYEIARCLASPIRKQTAGLLADQEIAFLNCATSEEQATVHYRMLLRLLDRLDIAPIAGSIARGLQCLLPDRLRLISLHSNARSLRGRTAKVVVFDELAHFQRTDGPASDEEVFRALAPSVRTFGGEGRVLITSSPADPQGVLWDCFEARGQVPGLLVAQFATWEFNPHLARADLNPEFLRHPAWASSEYGAQFPDRAAAAFLPLELVRGAVTHTPRDIASLSKGSHYFAHCDLGLVHDRTAIAVGHWEHSPTGSGRAVIDLVQVWSGSKATPVELRMVEAWLLDLARQVPLAGVSADPYESRLLLERLAAHGIRTVSLPYSGPRKHHLYSRLEEWLRTGQLALPDHVLLIAELTALRRIRTAQGAQYHAPRSGAVTTDDCADAVAGLLEWLADASQHAGPLPSPRWVPGQWE
ncbi:MAG: hypothetical protein ABI743_11920 [bacterium]